MEQSEKKLCDILVKAGWLENVVEPLYEQEGQERALHWRKGTRLLDHGGFRLWLFAELHDELSKAGLNTMHEICSLLDMGRELGVKQGWDKNPPTGQ